LLSDTTANQGGDATVASVTAFYLSVDSIAGPGDVLLGHRPVPALAAAGQSTGSTSLTIPPDTVTGSYYVVAVADDGDANAETNETNNSYRWQVRIGPDLLVSSLTVPAGIESGAVVSLSDTIKNGGGGPAGASTARFYFSTNGGIDASDQVLASRPVPALAAGASSSGVTSVTVPAGTPPGTYYILLQADAGLQVVETKETNNVASAQVQIGADFTFVSMSVPSPATGAGSTVSVSDVVRNAGGGEGPASTIRFYLSPDAALDATDVVLGSRAVPVLAAGLTNGATTPLVIPPATTTGTWYLVALADADHVATETSETNNTRTITVRVGPDLTVSSVGAVGTLAPGSSFFVTDTTRNAGGGAAPATTTRFYLSANAVLDAGDVDLGARAVPVLAGGATHVGVTSLTVPVGTAPGRYYLVAQADGAAAVPEVYETNNTYARIVTVDP
jgi:subtilase family serine protease